MYLMKLFFISGIVIVKALENVGKIGPVENGHKWLLQQITQCKKVRISIKHHQKLFWLSAWSNQVFKGLLRSLFSHRFLLIMQKKRTTTVDSQTQFDILRIEFRLTLNLGEIGKVAKKSVDPYK